MILINTPRLGPQFLLTTEAMIHKELKKAFTGSYSEKVSFRREVQKKFQNISCTLKYYEGHYEHVEKIRHEGDITNNWTSQHSQKDKMKIYPAAKRLTATLKELKEYLAVTVHSLQLITISHVFFTNPGG